MLSIELVRDKLIEIEIMYSDAITPFERAWTTDARKEQLLTHLSKIETEPEFASSLLSLEEGFSWPLNEVE